MAKTESFTCTLWARMAFCVLAFGALSVANAVKPTVRRRSLAEAANQVTVSAQDAVAFKPMFHITPESGWMNDPGGLFEHNGYLHVFPQANPTKPVWAAPNWAHVVSKDRVHYQRVRPACVADQPYDINGCWTGSCFPDEEGNPLCWYTAASGVATVGYNVQRVAQLVALNGSDPLLQYWVKPTFNPLYANLPEGVSNSQFRDPISPWQEDGKWLMALGGSDNCAGSQLLYSTTNLTNATFQYEAVLADQYGLGQVSGQCPVLSTASAPNYYCNQFGSTCRVWECTDYFELENGVYVLKWSDQDLSRQMYAEDHYVVSDVSPDFSEENLAAQNMSSAMETLFVDSNKGQSGVIRLLDFGTIYASKSWEDALGRRLYMGWSFETAVGCVQQCSAGTNFTDTLGYQGSQHLIRHVTYDNSSKALIQYPIPEYAALVNQSLYSGTVSLQTGSNMTLSLREASQPVSAKVVRLATSNDILQSDLQVNFSSMSNSSSSTSFIAGAIVTFNAPSSLFVYLNGTVNNNMLMNASVWVDTSNLTNTLTNTSYILGGAIPLPSNGVSANNLQLRLNVDHSHMEVYALGGRSVGTFKVYPNNIAAGNWTMSVFSASSGVSATASLDSWTLCWIEDATATNPVLTTPMSESFASMASQAYSTAG